ncbi:MarR family winged helix-turn-helix transcriptional regulator [Saccharothrix coeruleofusca]|uniref:MarR family transcriptional regulator n=1 Tax=Saccharothrix coeruleofusca TaxID=33919 RepID=A0A918AWN9_9PSEU|nr:MarR family transcriptional regulator [Saccharothrix coeruleofusca]MBP2335858.1 DNA-binding MarR family transcriptional regulator [Saccharothrix coeruleofusca]GGP87445.1 MarR family transcriptional regulator [Saccharothrix coeruleofusca]
MAEARWLTDDEQRTWRSFLIASRLLFDRLEKELKQNSNLSFATYEILARLSESPGRSMRMADLAAACVFDRSRLSHAIDRLVRSGWVRRVPSTSDARGQLAELTDEGARQVRESAPGHVELVRSLLFDRLSREQQESLREVSTVLATGVLDPARLDRMGWPAATPRPDPPSARG